MKSHLSAHIKPALYARVKIIEVFRAGFNKETKGDDSSLTLTDNSTNDILSYYLSSTDTPVISAENDHLANSEGKERKCCWRIDSLIEIKNNTKRNDEFTVNFSFVEDSFPTHRAIGILVSKTLYFTSECQASNEIILDSENISMDEVSEKAIEINPQPIDALVKIKGSRSYLAKNAENFVSDIESKNEVEILAMGSFLRFSRISKTLAQIYPLYAPTIKSDILANHSSCKAIDVEIIHQTTGAPMKYNKSNLLNNHFKDGNIAKTA